MNKITKAIIPVAGYGTRRLPITKAIEKCMLPIGNRPIVDYIVEDCIRLGVKDIYFVTSPNATQIRKYYSRDDSLERTLTDGGKDDMVSLITPPSDVRFHFTVQEVQNGSLSAYGKAIEEFGIDEPAIFSSGDDVVYRSDGGSDLADLVASLGEGESGMLAGKVEPSEIGRYGVLSVDDGYLKGFVEKPSPEAASSNLINVVKWVFAPEVIRAILADYKRRNYTPDREHHYVDAMLDVIDGGHKLKVQVIKGEYLDCGSLEGWLKANEVVGKDLL
jgi:UTP--glucose-1-phosphate uridylyltransferase